MTAVTIEVPDSQLSQIRALCRRRHCTIDFFYENAATDALAALSTKAPHSRARSVHVDRQSTFIDRSTHVDLSGWQILSGIVFAPVVRLAVRLFPNSDPREMATVFVAGALCALGVALAWINLQP